jgi:hypothetical protein
VWPSPRVLPTGNTRLLVFDSRLERAARRPVPRQSRVTTPSAELYAWATK